MTCKILQIVVIHAVIIIIFPQKLNPNVEAPLSKLLDHIQDNIEERKKTADYKIAFTDIKDSNEKKAFLTVNTKLAGLPYIWKFMTTPADKDMVSLVYSLFLISFYRAVSLETWRYTYM